MTLDAHLPHPSVLEAAAVPSLWTLLTPRRGVLVVPQTADAELGYESALPWTLGDEAPVDGAQARY